MRERERERIGPWLEFYQFQFAAGLALSSLTLLRLYLCVFVSDHVRVCCLLVLLSNGVMQNLFSSSLGISACVCTTND